MSRERAVVVGGSVAGLLAALAASEHFDEVLVVERDELGFSAQARKGVPQGRHVHGLLSIGMEMACEFIPDLREQLLREGCSIFDQIRDMPTMTSQGWRLRAESTVKTIGFRRPLFDSVLYRNISALPNGQIEVGAVAGLLASEDGSVVTGVRTRAGKEIPADLVIDATGRGSQAAKWIEQLGYEGPAEMQVRCFMGYATRLVKVPEGLLDGETAGIISMPFPGHHRGGILIAADSGYHILTAAGMARDYPPSDDDAFLKYLDQAPAPVIGSYARECEPVSDIATYHQPGNRRRLWERLARRPRGFIVTGDAVASYNPVYGQGMTQAAKGAVVLRDCLRENDDPMTLPERFQAGLAAFTDEAFNVSAMADTFYEGAELENVERPKASDYTYLTTLEQLATEDPEVLVTLATAQYSMRLEDLESDELRAKAAAWTESGRSVTNTDGSTLPPVTVAAA